MMMIWWCYEDKVQVIVWSGPQQTCFEAGHTLKADQVSRELDWIGYDSSDDGDEEQDNGDADALLMASNLVVCQMLI